jgi:hypothetical protein
MREWIEPVANAIFGRWKRLVLIIIVVITLIAVIAPIASWLIETSPARFPSAGYIRTTGVMVYDDPNVKNATKEILWGTIYLGSKINVTKYVRSISNVDTTINMTTGNWTFTNSHNTNISEPANRQSYMNLTWDYDNTIVGPGQVIQVTLILTVEDNPTFIDYLIQNDVRAFSFDINIYTN